MDKPINFNLAKLLEEKGFEGNTYYDKVGWGSLVWYHKRYKELYPQKNFGSFENMLVAPTIAEVIMWIYNKHKIWIEVNVEQYENGNNFLWQAINLATPDESTGLYGDNGEYKSPEKAYEGGIEYILYNKL